MKRSFLLLVILAVTGSGFIAGYRINPTPILFDGDQALDAAPGLAIPTLQTLIAGAKDDRDGYARIGAYFEANQERLRAMLAEDDPQRLKALFVMYAAHISHPYNTVESPADTLIGYVYEQTASHCSWYTEWQHRINLAIGLTSRRVMTESADHGWVEVRIGDKWEIFDSTANVWISESGEVLKRGEPRRYRRFYLVAATVAAPNAAVVKLAREMPGLGIGYARDQKIVIRD